MAGQRLGQHFLTARPVLERIAGSACPQRQDLVIEIGPGRGALTEYLLPLTDRLVAVEIDHELVARLRQRFSSDDHLTVIETDVLEADLTQWGPATVAGNLPYYITSPILTKLFEMGGLLRYAVLLVQLEVAERLTASPGSRDYGFLSVHTQLFTKPEILFRVPPGAFSPPPKVESAVVRLEPRSPHEAWGIEYPERFLEFASRCFRQKRKTLRNNLVASYGKETVEAWPEARMRAEQLSIDNLVDLYRRLPG